MIASKEMFIYWDIWQIRLLKYNLLEVYNTQVWNHIILVVIVNNSQCNNKDEVALSNSYVYISK